MAQVNVTYADDLVAALDRVAAARRMARPELLRAIALEAVDAHDAGRLAFRREDGPRLDSSISGLVVELREALIETSRMQNENLRFAKRLQEAFTGSEETVRAALEKVWAHIRKLNTENFHPFEDRLGRLTDHLEAAEERTQAAVKVELSAIHQQLAKVLKVAGEARVQHNLILGDNRTLSLRFLMRMAWLVGLLWVVLFLLIAGHFQSLALFTSHRLIDSDERLCRLVNWHVGADDCRVPEEIRKRALMVIAVAEDKEAETEEPGASEEPQKPKGARR